MTRVYSAPPTIGRLFHSQKRMQFLFGPLGGGKTTGVLMKIMAMAHMQRPSPYGVRKTRWACVRNTRPQLRDSVLKTVFEWLPPNGRSVHWHETDMNLIIDHPVGDGTRINCEIMFRALDDERDARRLLSVEYTGAWLSEFREIPHSLLVDVLSRTGRYPAAVDGGSDWYGVIGESNMCTKGSDWYDFLVTNLNQDLVDVFVQPSGIAPDAENKTNLKPDYYTMLMNGARENWIDAHIRCVFPDSLDGKAVWAASYNYERHVAKEELKPIGAAPIIIGVDASGRSPAAVATQMAPNGQLRALRETYASGVGMDTFASQYLRPMVNTYFPTHPILLVIDPAGCSKSDVNDMSPSDVLELAGFQVQPAPSNNLERRISAVERIMLLHDGLLISPTCRMLINACASDYRYRTKKDGELEDKPEKKHPISDVADSLQYAAMIGSGAAYGRIMNRMVRKKAPPTEAPPSRGWAGG